MTEAQRLQDAITHAVVAVELLDWHGKLQGSLENSFKKRVYNAALPRLRRLTNRAESAKEDFRIDKNGVKQSRPSRVHDSTLERQFTLGNLFTRVALSALQRQDQATWTALAQLRGRQEFMRSEMHPDEDPAAKELVSFSQAVIEMPDGRQMQVRDRAVGHNDAQSCIWVLPVFVDHDRSTHAERQALLVILQSLPVAKDEGVPADIKGRARVFATHTPCISCLSSMCQFTRAFEGASLAVGFDVWKETRRWIGLKGPDMTPMGGNLEEKVELEPFELDC